MRSRSLPMSDTARAISASALSRLPCLRNASASQSSARHQDAVSRVLENESLRIRYCLPARDDLPSTLKLSAVRNAASSDDWLGWLSLQAISVISSAAQKKIAATRGVI